MHISQHAFVSEIVIRAASQQARRARKVREWGDRFAQSHATMIAHDGGGAGGDDDSRGVVERTCAAAARAECARARAAQRARERGGAII